MRERVVIRGKESYSEKSGKILVEVKEFECFLLGPTDVAGIVGALAENACGGGG